MDNDILQFWIEQIDWVKEQDILLAKIEEKLYVLRSIMIYRLTNSLLNEDIAYLQKQIDELQLDIITLENELNSKIIH